MTAHPLLCAGPHVGGRPVLGTVELPDDAPPPDDHGALCEDCGLIYTAAQQLPSAVLQRFQVGAGHLPSVDVMCALLLAFRPAGYTPRYPPGQASWAHDASWPPPVPAVYAAALAKLPKYPRQGPQT